jgi:hypothetical protein
MNRREFCIGMAVAPVWTVRYVLSWKTTQLATLMGSTALSSLGCQMRPTGWDNTGRIVFGGGGGSGGGS